METRPSELQLQRVVDALELQGFYSGCAPENIDSIKAEAVRCESVLDEAVPRLFQFDLEYSYESEGADLHAAANVALAKLHGESCQIDEVAVSALKTTDWQEHASMVAVRINAWLTHCDVPERLYLVRFDELCWGALLTQQMADLVKESGAFDPEAATLYLP